MISLLKVMKVKRSGNICTLHALPEIAYGLVSYSEEVVVAVALVVFEKNTLVNYIKCT